MAEQLFYYQVPYGPQKCTIFICSLLTLHMYTTWAANFGVWAAYKQA